MEPDLQSLLLSKEGPLLQEMDPRHALNPSRLDLILKYQFFRSLAGLESRAQWEPWYRKHIQDRTKGVEPRDRFQKQDFQKRSVDDYVVACKDMLQSFRAGGFNPSFPIPVSSDRKLLNGAHRIACALATNQSITVAPSQLGSTRPWGFQWFAERDYPAELLAALLYHYWHLTTRRTGILILWGPALSRGVDLLSQLKEEVTLVGWLDLEFESNPAAFESIIHDIYALQWNDLEDANIRRKTILLNQCRRLFRVILVEDLPERGTKFPALLKGIRAQIRSGVRDIVPEDAFCSCHASLSETETKYLVELLLGEGSRKHQLLRTQGRPREQFSRWLLQLGGELAQLGLSREDVCIVGSSPLEVVGLRSATDIDITFPSRFRSQFGPGVTHLTDWLDAVTQGYARSSNLPPISDDELVANPRHHFWYRGFKFAHLDIVLRRKAYQKRPKDLADVALAKRAFATQAHQRMISPSAAGADLIAHLVRREKSRKGFRL